MYTALYRTERPETFDEILGQEHIVKILKNQVKTGTVSHAYLFTGTRGTGKTSTARILAKAVNCTGEGEKPCGKCPNCVAIKEGAFMDMIEIDAASNNGVDSVRELRESVNYPPAVGKKKVYIIDEAHMLTPQALNALLKTLEEPPDNVMFILATTDPQKLLQTILSRCLRLDFRRIPDSIISSHMEKICNARGITIEQDALRLLASNADGSVRDGLSLLDQCLSGGGTTLDRDTVLEYLGTAADDFFIKLTDFILQGNAAEGIVLLDEMLRDGKDVKQLVSDWLSHYRSLLISKYVASPENILNMSTENVNKLVEQCNSMSVQDIEHGIMTLSKTVSDVRYSSQPRILMELAIVVLAGSTDMTEQTAPTSQQSQAAKSAPKQPAPKTQQVPPKQPAPEQPAPMSQQSQAEKPAPKQAAPASQQSQAEKPVPKQEEIEPAYGDRPLTEIWESIWDRIGSRGTMVMVKLNSYLAGISGNDFKVIFTNRYAMEQAQKHVQEFVDAMEQEVSKKLKMVSAYSEPEEPAQQSFMGEEIPVSQVHVNDPMADQTSGGVEEPAPWVNTEVDYEELAQEVAELFDIKPRIE